MSYLRPPRLQPEKLEVQAGLAWCRATVQVLQHHKHSFSDSVCLRVLRCQLGKYVSRALPPCLRQELFQQGCRVLRREVVWSALRDFVSPDLFVPFLSVCYTPDTGSLELPPLIRLQDRVTVLETLQALGPHSCSSIAFKLWDCPAISAQEQSLARSLLQGFPNLSTLTLWRACDDFMLEVLGSTCSSLASLDIWKSAQATDRGVRALLGLDLARPRALCASFRSIAIRDTSISDGGAFQLLIHCHSLAQLQYNTDSFLQQLQWRIEQNYLLTHTVFTLKTVFLQVSKASQLQSVVQSLPSLEDLTVWTALEEPKGLTSLDLARVASLKLGGLNHPNFLAGMATIVGPQLTCLKLETVHFDIDVHVLGRHCTALTELHIINARVKVGLCTEREEQAMFPLLASLYCFLVQYPVSEARRGAVASTVYSPGGVARPATGHTALHALLAGGRALQSVQVSGSPALTDTCMAAILDINPLVHLKRLVISHPLSLGHMVVPLTTLTLARIQASCPLLECVGDLKHWAVTAAQRRKMARAWL